MGKKHFSDNKSDRRGGRNAGGPGSFGRDNDRGSYSGSRPEAGRPATNGAFGRPSGPYGGGKKFGSQGEKRSFSGPRPDGYAGREQGGGRSFERPYERRDDRPRPGKEQRTGTSYGRSTSQPERRSFEPRDERPIREYQPKENWPGQPYRREGEKAVPRGNPGERNRKFQKQNPNERNESTGSRGGDGFGRSTPREANDYQRRDETGPGRPIRPARPFSAEPPQPREERRGFNRDDQEDREAFGHKFTPGAFGKRESFNPRSREDRPTGRTSRERPAPGSFAERREAMKAQERSVRRSGTAYGSGTRDKAPVQSNRADKPRYGEVPGEAPDYKNLKHYENDKTRGNKRRREDADFGGDELRLNRYIANAGICSRREADALIAAGEIRVNGEVVTEMGYKVQPTDTVQYGKTNLNREKLVYVLLNKPKDFITTTEDPEGRRTVMDLVAGASKERIFPVGRLDRNTTGLLLFTNDGEVAQKLSHPSHMNKKIYQVELSKPLTEDHLRQIAEGLELEDGKAVVDDVAVVAGNPHFVGIEIHIGRNRIVRRIFEHLGYEVVALDRVQYAGITKKDLPRGKWRFLTEQEVIRLKYFM
ncbi:pseudouridine synthase [Hymenobacter saemangeumensis]|uniref:Pseudouridine synthase n=1 Tax=Hymenobacter saemangeumensis TaxID=1084522 RepID=A0ABP8I4X9_9BACT